MAKDKIKRAGPASAGLEVTAKRPSFWRGGQHFGAEARVVPLSDLSDVQAEQIRTEGEPGGMLIVREVEIKAEA